MNCRLFTKIFALLLLLMSFSTVQAQVAPVELNTEVFTTSAEDEIVVVLTANNFERIVAMQFSLNWDPSVLEFKEIGDFNLPDLSEGTFNTAIVENGELSVAWFDTNVSGQSVEDGTNLFSITFTKLSEVPSAFFFDNTPTKIEFVAFPFNEVPFNSTVNEIVVTGRLLEGTVLFDANDNCALDDVEKGLKDWSIQIKGESNRCLLYTSDAADE